MKGRILMSENILDRMLEDEEPKDRHSKLMESLHSLDDFADSSDEKPTFTVSSTSSWLDGDSERESTYYSKGRKKKRKKQIVDEEVSSDDWMHHLMEIDTVTVSSRKNRKDFIFNEDGELVKKKKKKKKKEGELTDFNKEFSPEMSLYHSLLRDQQNLVDSLQKQYNGMISSKGTSRGITKATTDLIANITSARATAMQLVDKTVALKKTCYDLAAKEKKEMNGGVDGDNMSDYAGAYLKQMISSRNEIMNIQDYDIEDMDEQAMSNALNEVTSGFEREEDVDKYLKYENQHVTIYAYINSDDISDYRFMAEDENGMEILDYPLPPKTKLSVNRSINIATDEYGAKYNIRWE